MQLPLITDGLFYAVAIPAVILLGISKSGFGAGFGSLAVPLMALAVTVPQAAAILMPVLLVLDCMGQRLLFPPRADSPPPPRWLGAILTTTSGFTSFVAHSGGPPLAAYVLPLHLPPVVFTATLAVFFFSINMAKWLPYAWLGLLDGRNLSTSLALLPFAPVGVFIGVKLARRIPQVLFYRLITLGMLLTGLKLVWDGFLAR